MRPGYRGVDSTRGTFGSFLFSIAIADLKISQISSLDATNVHGAIVALTEIVGLLPMEDERRVRVSAEI